MLPSPSELRYFLEVANTLNISRASERLGISQPSLSLAIQRLENAIGTPLLIRSKSGVRLTKSGLRLVGQARRLLNEWERIRGDALKDDAELSGRYVFGCHVSVALYSLPSFLPRLLAENPGLEISLIHDLSRRITEDVISFKADFGIVVNPVRHPDLVIKTIAHDEVELWTGPQSASPLCDPHSGEAVLVCDSELLQSQSLMKQFERKGMTFKRTVQSSSLEVITSLVASGAGVGILPGRVARRIPSLGLKPYGKDSPKFADKVCLIFRRDVQSSQASRTLVKALERYLKTED